MMISWKDTYIHREADAEKVFSELERIEDRTPANIIKMAENPKSEMHYCFTWEDGEAAESWRRHEAKQMVNHLIVDYSVLTEKNENVEITINAFTSIPTDDGRQYVKTSDGIDNEILKQMIISEVRSLLSQAKNKMHSYAVFFAAKQFQEVEKLLKKIS